MAFAVIDFEKDTSVVRWAARLAALLFGLTLFRIAALYFNATDLFFGEAQYWSWSLAPTFGYYSKPPMITWLVDLSTAFCGSSEFCVRLPSPIIHMATALVVFAVGWRYYDARVGFWSALAFTTLPGISLSASIISADVPLFFFWAVALFAFSYLFDKQLKWWVVPLLGLALGLGLNAKYAMVYFIVCAMVYFALTPERRHFMRSPRWWLAVAIGVAMITPNLLWNYSESFAALTHTIETTRWAEGLFRPRKAIGFVGAQFGVFGPVLFAGLLIIATRWYKGQLPEKDHLLFAFAAPIILIITLQAFVSRAHANWATVGYVAATVLVTATMIRDISWGWLRTSLAGHVGVVLAMAVVFANAGGFRLPNGEDPFARTLGWENLANEARVQISKARKAGKPFGSVLTLDRSVTAELLYYLRDDNTPIRAWVTDGRPRDDYQLTLGYRGKLPDPTLLVAIGGIPFGLADQFSNVEYITVENIPAGAGAPRRVIYAKLSKFKPKK